MSNYDWNEEFHIEWDLHELGNRPAPHVSHGPTDPVRLAYTLAIARGEIPANAPVIDEDKAA